MCLEIMCFLLCKEKENNNNAEKYLNVFFLFLVGGRGELIVYWVLKKVRKTHTK